MNRFYVLLCLAVLRFSFLQAEIVEVRNFKEITNHITADTLVILDIDDTLLIPVQTLGTDVWFMARYEHHLRTKERLLALDRALAEWEAVRHMTDVKIVEEGTDEIIREMQQQNYRVMGLTTQGLALATRTVMQLKSLKIDLFKTAPSTQEVYFINGPHGVLYREGILFTSGTAKGEALVKLLDTIGYHPQHIVFINDKKTHLLDVEKSLIQRKIDFTGLRYSYSDERVASYSPEIAEIQWNYSSFGHILSDEEASSYLIAQ